MPEQLLQLVPPAQMRGKQWLLGLIHSQGTSCSAGGSTTAHQPSAMTRMTLGQIKSEIPLFSGWGWSLDWDQVSGLCLQRKSTGKEENTIPLPWTVLPHVGTRADLQLEPEDMLQYSA